MRAEVETEGIRITPETDLEMSLLAGWICEGDCVWFGYKEEDGKWHSIKDTDYSPPANPKEAFLKFEYYKEQEKKED